MIKFDFAGTQYRIIDNKLINDRDEVAVVYAPGFGAGWSTWESISPTDANVAKRVLLGERTMITKAWLKEVGALEDVEGFYAGAVEDLTIQWIPKGTKFRVHEYDGSESIETIEGTAWTEA